MAQAPEFKINTAFDMYIWYVKKLLAKDPSLKTKSDQLIKREGIVVVYKTVNGRKEIYITYTIFKSILEHNNVLAREAVIQGEVYKLGTYLGYLQARRVERNFAVPTVNVIATVQYWREHPEAKPRVKIYHQDEDFVRIAWHKSNGKIATKNLSAYDFKPCKDFRVTFGRMNISKPLLRFNYLFFPLTDKS